MTPALGDRVDRKAQPVNRDRRENPDLRENKGLPESRAHEEHGASRGRKDNPESPVDLQERPALAVR
jgi:hypothetical protein